MDIIKYTIDVNQLYKIRNRLSKYQKSVDEFTNLIYRNIDSIPVIDATSLDHQDQTHRNALDICKLKKFDINQLKNDPEQFLAYLFSVVNSCDLSVLAKIVIHFQLFGGSILELGTQYHHDKYFNDINSMRIVGGFAMTEMGHGSNVRQIETTAHYDIKSREFIINSPTLSSTKFWIGNVARFGTHVVLFCKLIFNEEDKGVHGIVVPLRDIETMKVYQGIEIGGCGPKIGWNGIDNAWIRFKNYRVPRENLLNKFANITESGEYQTTISSPGKLFQQTISQLVFGRMLYICGPIFSINYCLNTAIRYAFSRRQFGEKGKKEELIINYPSHYRVLMPMLSHLIAFEFTRDSIIEKLIHSKKYEQDVEETHAVVSGVKALINEYNMVYLNKLRAFCGGNGISSFNLFGYFRSELDIFQTAEGDGSVLYQQLSKFLLSEYKKWYKKEGVTGYIIKEVQSFLSTNPIYTHSRSMPYILSNEFHHHAFLYRFEKWRAVVIEKLSQSKTKGMSFMQGWNDSLLYVIEFAKAYTHLFILEQSHIALKKIPDTNSRTILNDLIKLYALSNIESDFGFYRNWNFISAGKAFAISDAVRDLCIAIKPYSLQILDSSKLDEHRFNIPLARTDGDYVKHMAERVGIPVSKL